MRNSLLLLLIALVTVACYEQEKNCDAYKTGKFKFEQVIDSVQHTSIFERYDDLQVEEYNGKVDSASVRWINDCEFILEKLSPKNMQDKKAIHFKILRTNQEGYFFEYNFVGDGNKQQGFVTKL